jgi:hypothetical protein
LALERIVEASGEKAIEAILTRAKTVIGRLQIEKKRDPSAVATHLAGHMGCDRLKPEDACVEIVRAVGLVLEDVGDVVRVRTAESVSPSYAHQPEHDPDAPPIGRSHGEATNLRDPVRPDERIDVKVRGESALFVYGLETILGVELQRRVVVHSKDAGGHTIHPGEDPADAVVAQVGGGKERRGVVHPVLFGAVNVVEYLQDVVACVGRYDECGSGVRTEKRHSCQRLRERLDRGRVSRSRGRRAVREENQVRTSGWEGASERGEAYGHSFPESRDKARIMRACHADTTEGSEMLVAAGAVGGGNGDPIWTAIGSASAIGASGSL